MTATPELFRKAWSKFPTGVSIVTTHTEDGAPWCTTANAVSSVSLDPLLVQLSLGKDGLTCLNILRERRFGINVLRAGDQEMASFFARGTLEERRRLPTAHQVTDQGTVLLDGALTAMACHVTQEVEAGDHMIFIAEVEHIELRTGDPLVFYGGGYTSIPSGGRETG